GRLVTDSSAKGNIAALAESYPTIGRLLAAIAGGSPDARHAHAIMYEILNEPKLVLALLTNWMPALMDLDDIEVSWALERVMEAAMLDHRLTNSGARRPWFDGRTLEIHHTTLNLQAPVDDLRRLWRLDFHPTSIIDTGCHVGSDDFPADPEEIRDKMKDVQLEGAVEQADHRIVALLYEARSAGQWSIPFGARVEVKMGPFVAMRIF